jgi:hypothetical protein
VDLTWEHGELQSVSIAIKKPVDTEALRGAFHLPQPGGKLPRNLSAFSIEDCGPKRICVVLEGVEHQGGGMRRGEAIVQPRHAEDGDGRHVNQNFRRHDEQDGQHQQLA